VGGKVSGRPGYGEVAAPLLDVLLGLVREDPERDVERADVVELNHEAPPRLVHGDRRGVWTSNVGEVVRVRRIVATVAEHLRLCPHPKFSTGDGGVLQGISARNRSWDRLYVVSQCSRACRHHRSKLIQIQIEFDAVIDSIQSTDTVEHQNLILAVFEMVDVTERELWQVRRLGAECVVSHKLRP
jgi:hypothetical protein